MSQALWILLVIVGYFVVWLAISYFSSKGADNSTFFSGNRKMPWPLVAVAMIGAPITGVTFVSVPGMVVSKGFSYLQMGLGFIVGYLIIAFVLIPIYYRLNIISIYEFLQKRFGQTSYKTGAWLFFISKIIGISIRFLIICAMLQLLVFDPLGIPYVFSVITGLLLIWLSTFKGGVKSVIWGDTLKSVCLLATIALCLYFIVQNLQIPLAELPGKIMADERSRIFFFDDPSDAKFFWKQFIAGIFIVVAMTGLDQDMMQRSLSCRNASDARKNLITGSIMQVLVISLLLVLGTVLMSFIEAHGMDVPEKTDNLFAAVAFHNEMPVVVGTLFVLGIVAATCTSVGSALTAMTTTVTIDILEADSSGSRESLSSKRKWIHFLICLAMGILVMCFYYINNNDAISTVYALISYTDGPILGLFLFGIFTKRSLNDRWLPVVCLLAPVLSWLTQWGARSFFAYEISFELLVFNAAFTFMGLTLLSALSSKRVIAAA